MAAIRKRGKRYHVQIRKKGHPPLTRSFLSLSDARAWARKVESEIERGMFIDVSKEKVTTVADLLNRFEKEVLLPQSNKAYRDKSRTGILKRALGSIFLSDLSPFHLATYMEKRAKQVGSQTIRHELGLLRSILNTAKKE
ncbi:MAG: site-specific integrase, partial [Pseudomonadota bacterium]|nr:site-specific integrase [Pseudomonadota bacterium]